MYQLLLRAGGSWEHTFLSSPEYSPKSGKILHWAPDFQQRQFFLFRFHLLCLARGKSSLATEYSSLDLFLFVTFAVIVGARFQERLGWLTSITVSEVAEYIMDAIKKGIGKVFGIRKSNEGTSEIGQIGHPTNVVHGTHVTVDKDTGQLRGLPEQWDRLLRKELGYVKWASSMQLITSYEAIS
jgi:P21-Rho-binding domain